MADEQNVNGQQGGNDNNKVEKQYQENLKKLIAILGGAENLMPVRTIGEDALNEVVENLLKEQREKTKKEVEDGLRELLQKHVEFQGELKKKKQELAQLEINKKKDFTEASRKVFSKLSALDDLVAKYKESLGAATSAVTEEEHKEE